MKKILPILIIVLLSKAAFADIVINEIMADPIADETLNEWVELYNEDSDDVDVKGWVIGDDKDLDLIEGGLFNGEGTIIPGFGYAIITDEATRVYNNFNVSQDAIRLYVDDAAIGNSLSNTGDTVFLYDGNNTLVDKVSYNKTKEDLSWALINGSFFISESSPGYANDVNLALDEEGCDFQIEFILAADIFENSSSFEFQIRVSKIKGEKTNFTGRAFIRDLFGTLIKEYKPWTNESITRQRTSAKYTPNLEEGKSYELNANVTMQCEDTNPDNNIHTRLITIKGDPLPLESSLSIESIQDLGSDKKAKFGQTIRVKVNVYKGDTTKNSIALWIEDKKGNRLSKQSKINIPEKYTNSILTVPIQIKPNCDGKFKDGGHTIIISGLDAENEKEIKIEDVDSSLCKTIKTEEKKKASSGNLVYELIEAPGEISVGRKFDVVLRMDNNNENDIDIKVWSYVYRGSKSYSGEREENKKEFVLKGMSSDVVELSNIVPEAEPGDYKLKVWINKDNQKTNKGITNDIKIINEKIELERALLPDDIIGNPVENKITAFVVKEGEFTYKSTSEKARDLVFWFLFFLFAFLTLILVWRR